MPRPALKIEAPELRLDPDLLLSDAELPEFFREPGPLEIEIGIGKGKFLLAAAVPRPEVRHLGVEWANKYLRFAEARSQRSGLTNVRFARVDARELVRKLVDRSVRAYYVFYPDPWPKKRHNKRRFIQPETIDQVSRSLVCGGTLHVCTDHADYWEAIEETMSGRTDFERRASFGGPEFPVSPDEPLTNFEVKYLVQGRQRNRASWTRRLRD